MASVSIQGRVDGLLWARIKQKGESNTELLQRLTSHYVATSADELTAIAPTPDAAISVLLNSHRLFTQLMQNAAVVLPSEHSSAQPPAEAPTCFDDEY